MIKLTLKLAILVIFVQLVFNLNPSLSQAVGETPLITGTGDQFQPAIDGDKVAWLKGTNDPYVFGKYSDVYLMTIGGAGQKINSVKLAHRPAISAGNVVWEDLRNDTGGVVTINTDIFGYALASGALILLPSGRCSALG